MSRVANKDVVYVNNFKGLDERPGQTDLAYLSESFNLEYRDGCLVRRMGRQKLLDTYTIRPSKVFWFDSTTLHDVTDAATDARTSGAAAITNAFSAGTRLLLVGFPFRVLGLNINLAAAAVGNATLTYSVFDRSMASFGVWRAVTVEDGTAIGGFTMKQSGSLLGTYQDLYPRPGFPNWHPGTSGTAAALDDDLFWIQLNVAGGVAGVNIYGVSGSMSGRASIPASVPADIRSESIGMAEFTSRTGERYLVSVNEWPGRYQTDATANAAAVETRVFSVDLGRGDMIPVRIPYGFRLQSPRPVSAVSFVVFNGWLIGPTSGGYLWRFNGAESGALEALIGLDARNGVIGAPGYLPQPPRGTSLEVYRNRLMVTRDPSSPLTFYASIEDNNISVIPPEASVGGPNVWPLTGVFNIPGREGDEITGASVINDRYVIFTRSQVWAFDDSSLRLINGDIGCVAPGSIQRVDNVVYFLSDRGVYVTDGVDSTHVSPHLESTLKTVNWQMLNFASSAHHKTIGEYWLWLPINGEQVNQIAIVFNYIQKNWRVVGGWYPFDANQMRDSASVLMSVTAACEARGANGKQILVSQDSDGIIWQENVGADDDGKIYPAYGVMRPLSAGESYSTFREWYLTMSMNGAYVEGFALGEGDRFDQELSKRYLVQPTSSEVAQKRAVFESSVPRDTTSPNYGSPPSWPVTTHTSKMHKLKLSFARSITAMQAAIHLPTGAYSAGYFSTGPPVSAKIQTIQIGHSAKPDGR